jgi:hypothetical protein
MTGPRVVSLAEYRALRRSPHDDPPPPARPLLRLVDEAERPGDAFRLDVFLERARILMAERPPLELVASPEQHAARGA